MAARTDPKELELTGQADRGWRARWRRASDGCQRWWNRNRNRKQVPVLDEQSDLPDALAELRPLCEQLEHAKKGLSPLAATMEQAFLAIADSLVELPEASGRLVKHSHQLVAMSTGRDGGDSIYQTTYTSLAVPLEFVDGHWEKTRQLRGQLQVSLDAIDEMLRRETDLARTVSPLKYIQTLFKVESAGLDASVQGMFLALTEEISGLQRKVSDTFGEKFQILRDLRRILESVVGDLARRDQELDRFLSQRRELLQQALQELRADLERNQRREIKLTQITNHVSEQVGRLVLGLQAQDIVAQKIAHVIEGLGRMLERTTAPEAKSTPEQDAALLRFLAQSATVEHAQLQSIRQDLQQTEDQLSSAIGTIENQVGQLDEECMSMREFDRITVAFNGLIETLLEAIEGVSELVDTTVTSTDRAFTEIQPLGGRTSNVTQTMRELSAHIRVIALNAQVQAARLDSGTGLEVLAAATNRVAVETAGISEEIAAHLDQFASAMDDLVKTFTTMHDRGLREQQAWHERSQAERSALHAVRDGVLSELHSTVECANHIRELVRRMRDKVNISTQLDPIVCVPGEALAKLSGAAGQVLLRPPFAGLAAPSSAADAEYSRTFTMESERKVHEAALAAASASAAAASGGGPGSVGSAPAISEIAPAESAGAADPATGPGQVALTQLSGLAETATADNAASDKKEFGDNVDLF